jgi:hypothetical protein
MTKLGSRGRSPHHVKRCQKIIAGNFILISVRG